MALDETLVIFAILGIGAMGTFITAGVRMHQEYRASRTLLSSPFP